MNKLNWVDAHVRQPEHRQQVLICFNNCDYYIATYIKQDKCFITTPPELKNVWIKEGNDLSWVALNPPDEDASENDID